MPDARPSYQGAILIKDDLFKDSSYNIEVIGGNLNDTSNVDIKVKVSTISRDKYFYSQSLYAYENASGNPFAEPVIVYTNVENGQGIFSMEGKTEIIVE